MTEGVKTLIFPVSDLEAAKATFSKLLGQDPSADTPYYVGYTVNGQDIGLDPNGHKSGMTGAVAYLKVDDIQAAVDALVDGGGQAQGDVRDVGGGRRIVSVKDADGNVLGLLQDS